MEGFATASCAAQHTRMNTSSVNAYRRIAPPLVAGLAVLFSFLWQGHKGFNLGDEGFLWYGTQQVLAGEVPIRDFMAYDPGRYYWSAALMSLFGNDGIMSLRAAVAIFQVIGLSVGLLLIGRTFTGNRASDMTYLLLGAVTLLAWMYPRHKLFDISLSILLIGTLTYWIEKPTSHRYYLAGLAVGVAAFFGRNHGLYGAAGSLGALLFLALNRVERPGWIKGGALWCAGVVTGYAPMLYMWLAIPGFRATFFRGVRSMMERGSTNLTLPIPWPWRVDFAALPIIEAVRGVLIGCFFLGIVIFGVLSLVAIIHHYLRGRAIAPVWIACALLALPYAHYAYSRADVGHLAHGIFPLLIGALFLLYARRPAIKWPLALLLGGASLGVMYALHPGWQARSHPGWTEVEISGDRLQVDPFTAHDIALLRELVETYAPDGQNFLATPYWPGAYALMGQRSPMWAHYALWPRSEERQLEEIERLREVQPRFALVIDFPLDGREDRRFRHTNPLIYQYIREHFEDRSTAYHSVYEIYVAREAK